MSRHPVAEICSRLVFNFLAYLGKSTLIVPSFGPKAASRVSKIEKNSTRAKNTETPIGH
jgi:hypothetical protein